MTFALLKDSTTETQLMVRNEHISAVEIKKSDEAVVIHLLGGQTLHLNHEQSKQFLHHIKAHLHITG